MQCALPRDNPLSVERSGDSLLSSVTASLRPKGTAVITIPEVLTFDQQNLLTTNFPEFNLEFRPHIKHQHPYSAASRRCELSVLLSRLNVLSTPPSKILGYDDFVCDIGGDFTSHLISNRHWVHSCCPLRDLRDRQRQKTRHERLLRLSTTNPTDTITDSSAVTRACEYLETGSPNFLCSNLAQDCPRTARYGISLHSCYDITLMDFANIMVNKQMTECYGTFIYSDTILLEPSGIIEGIDCFYTIDEANDKIEFSFENDPSTVYRHSLKVYMSLLTVNYFYSADKKFCFFVELLENRSGIQFFKISKLDACKLDHDVVTRFLWLPSLKGKTKVNYFEVNYTELAKGSFKTAFVPVSFYVDTSFVDKIICHAYASTESKFRPVEIFNFLTAYNGRIFFGSDVCVRYRQLPAAKAMLLANAVYLHVFIKKYDIGKINQLLMGAIKEDRELSEGGFFKKLFRRKYNPAKLYGTGHHTMFRGVRAILQPLHAFLYWLKRSPVFAHQFIQDNVKFIRCDTDLKPIDFVTHSSDYEVVDKQQVPLPEVLLDNSSFDIRKLLSSVLGDFVTDGKKIVESTTLEHVTCKFLKNSKNHSTVPPNGFTKNIFSKVLTPNSKLFEIFDQYTTNDYSDTNDTFQSLDALALDPKSKVLVVTKNNVDLVNYLSSTGNSCYLLGFSENLIHALNKPARSNSILIDGDLNFSTIFSSSFGLTLTGIVIDSNAITEEILCAVLSSKIPNIRTYINLKSNLSLQYLCYFLSCVKYERFSSEELNLNPQYFKIKRSSMETLRLSLQVFCEEYLLRIKTSSLEDTETTDRKDLLSTNDSSESSSETFHSGVTSLPKPAVLDDLTTITSTDQFEFGTVSAKLEDSVAQFVSELDISTSRIVGGKLGNRHEWLFAPCAYEYPGASSLTPISTTLPAFVGNFDIFNDFNALLVVYYPESTSGLSLHKDDEAAMINHTVLTLSFGGDCKIRLKNQNTGTVNEVVITPKNFYILKNQTNLLHGVTDNTSGRFALTFRKFLNTGLNVFSPLIVYPNKLFKINQYNFKFAQDNDDLISKVFNDKTVLERTIVEKALCLNSGDLDTYNVEVLPLVTSLNKDYSCYICPVYSDLSMLKNTNIPFRVLLSGIYSKPTLMIIFSSKFLPQQLNSNKPVDVTIDCTKRNIFEFEKFIKHHLMLTPTPSANYPPSKVQVISSKILNIVKPTKETVVVDNVGMGDCLFLALSGSNPSTAALLRGYLATNRPTAIPNSGYLSTCVDEECAADGVWAGTHSILAFCHLYFSNVTVLNSTTGEVILTSNDFPNPLQDITLRYSGNHYTRNTSCCNTSIVSDILPFKVNPVNPEYVLDTLNKVCFSSAPAMSVKGIGDKPFVHFAAGVKTNFFLNPLRNFCFSSSCTCFDGIREAVTIMKDSDISDCCVLFPLGYPKEDLHEFLASEQVSVKFGIIPSLCKRGYILLFLTLRADTIPPKLGFWENIDRITRHVNTCDNCSGNALMSEVTFDVNTNTIYFCSKFLGIKTSFVDSLDGVPVILKLSIVANSSVISDKILNVDGKLLLPIRVVRVGVLTNNSRNLKTIKNAIFDYFSRNGSVSVLGVENCGLHDFGPLFKYLEQFATSILVQSKSVKQQNLGVDFQPDFVPGVGDESIIVNSLVEAREYYKAAVTFITNNLKPLHRQYIKIFSNTNILSNISDTTNNRPDFGLIDMDNAKFIIQPKDDFGPYCYAYNGNTLVNIQAAFTQLAKRENAVKIKNIRDWLRPGVFSGYYSVIKDSKLVNSEKIFSKLSTFDVKKLSLNFSIKLVEGVPGCGKTHYIIKNHNFSLGDTDHIVLTSSREAANDLRRRVAKQHGVDVNHYMLKRRYRTVDSFLMHYTNKDYCIDTIWLDEGLMRHFGDGLWCAVISNCKNLIIIGDRAQIPFINRIGGIVLNYETIKLSKSTLKTEFLDVTHRCPVDVAAILNRLKVYNSPVYSSSPITKSIETRLISNVQELQSLGLDRFQILTFGQNEKVDLAKLTGMSVFTVNEFQGNQAKNVLLIRTNTKDTDLYNSINHILVGISRHTEKFVYASVVKDKTMGICSHELSTNELKSCKKTKFDRNLAGVQLFDVNRNLGGGLIMGKTRTKQYPFFKSVPRAATMVDMLKQQAKIRDFVQNNLGSCVVPLRVDLEEVPIELPELPFSSHYYVSDCNVTLQHIYNSIFPGHSLIDTSYDDEIFLQDDLYFSTLEMLRLTQFNVTKKSSFDCMSPSLKTSCPTPVSNSLKHVLKAFYDRNGNVPKLSGLCDDEAIVARMYDVFVQSCVADKELYSTFCDNPVTVNVDSIEDWLFTQPPIVSDMAFDQQFWSIFDRELNVYSLILKKLPKPRLDIGAMGKYPSPQTIAHLTKDVNAVFCPIFREIKRRLTSVLRDNVIFFSDMSIEDFEKILTVRFPSNILEKMKYLLEIDMSKYDKSQGRIALLFEIKLLRALGFPETLLSTWAFMHVYSRVIDRINKVVARILFQRKSGDAWTFGGNTVHLIAVLIYALNLINPGIMDDIASGRLFLLFSGDDSLIFSIDEIDTMQLSSDLANCFNLESKLLKFHTPYFCSKFLIMTPWGRWVIVPDPIKMLIKLGRHDLLNSDHVEEYRISCLDVGRHFGNSVLYPLLDCCVIDRYKIDMYSLSPLYSALYTVFADRDKFKNLYFTKDGAVLSEKIFRKVFDM